MGKVPESSRVPPRLADHRLHVPVGLVVDLPDDLLDQVLDGDDALDRAAFIDDEGELRPFLTHVPGSASVRRRVSGMDSAGGRQSSTTARCREQVPEVDDADDVVQTGPDHRGPEVADCASTPSPSAATCPRAGSSPPVGAAPSGGGCGRPPRRRR